MLPVTVLCPSTAIDCVNAVAIALLFASTWSLEITVPATKLGYGFV
jgi:hypothetical protein